MEKRGSTYCAVVGVRAWDVGWHRARDTEVSADDFWCVGVTGVVLGLEWLHSSLLTLFLHYSTE